eukprot:351806-Chlamydomonas_euryale.AAC.10
MKTGKGGVGMLPRDIAPPAVSPPCPTPSAAHEYACTRPSAPGVPRCPCSNGVTVDPETGETVEPEPPADFECDDIVADSYLFDALGVGLGRQEMYTVMLAAKKLGGNADRGVQTVRFFGKFFGTTACYYVFECTVNEPPELPEAPEGATPNESGTGANNYTYYVCNYLGGPFTMLPAVTPGEIKAARAVRKFLTGKLDAPVSTYPLFLGTEAAYLRCQITRIACATVCCPAGSFVADEDSGELSRNEEWEGVRDRESGVPSAWAHRYPHLKAQVCTHRGACVV